MVHLLHRLYGVDAPDYGCQISSDEIRDIFVHQFIHAAHANSPRSAYSHSVGYCTYIIKHSGPKKRAISAKIGGS